MTILARLLAQALYNEHLDLNPPTVEPGRCGVCALLEEAKNVLWYGHENT
jgi:hypothetical protein